MRKATYSWKEINQALMDKGYAPARIADILSKLVSNKKIGYNNNI